MRWFWLWDLKILSLKCHKVSHIQASIGFSLVGLGLAVIIPIAFSEAGNLENIPSGVGIGFVSTIGYAGMLIGPPLIGGVGWFFGSLRFGMLVDGFLLLGLTFLSPVFKRKSN